MTIQIGKTAVTVNGVTYAAGAVVSPGAPVEAYLVNAGLASAGGAAHSAAAAAAFSIDASGNVVVTWGTQTGQLPTTLPTVAGCLWNNGGVLSIS